MAELVPRVLPVFRGRESPFAYTCNGCGRCCHDKAIRVGPYEVARIAEALGVTTTHVLDEHVDPDVGALRQRPDGSCVLLREGRCSVHQGRPLACRLYPETDLRVRAVNDHATEDASPRPIRSLTSRAIARIETERR